MSKRGQAATKKGNMKMIKPIVLLILAAMLLCGTAAAQDGGFGLGVILGEPTGICGKLWLGGKTAIDGAAAWSFNKGGNLHLHSDYLLHSLYSELGFYYGLGVRVKLADDRRVGVRFPLGISYMGNTPLDIFLEAAPLLDLAPSTAFRVNAAIGFRFFLW